MAMSIDFEVAEIHAEDVGKGFSRLNPEDTKNLNAVLGDVVEIIKKTGEI